MAAVRAKGESKREQRPRGGLRDRIHRRLEVRQARHVSVVGGQAGGVLALREAILDIVEGPWSTEARRAYIKVLAQRYPERFVALIAKALPNPIKVEGQQPVQVMFPCDSVADL